ncbi:hypothetical protein BV20DRAFT_966215, partial [Pilatotrama ljubarskyi]
MLVKLHLSAIALLMTFVTAVGILPFVIAAPTAKENGNCNSDTLGHYCQGNGTGAASTTVGSVD